MCINEHSTKKSSIKPRGGAYLISDTPDGRLKERDLIREGGSFKKFVTTIYICSVLLPHILRIQHTILWVRYINSTQFLSQTVSKSTCNQVLLVTGQSLLALVKAKGTETLRLGACSYQSTFLNQS